MTLASVVVPIYCLTFLNADDDRRQKLAKVNGMVTLVECRSSQRNRKAYTFQLLDVYCR